MAKVEEETKYARVMHHIGGLSGKNDNTDMLRGGEDELNLVTSDYFADMDEDQVKRLFEIGALREATPDEVKRFEINAGIREAEPDEPAYTGFTTGNQTLKADEGKTGAVKQGSGDEDSKGQPSSGHQTYKGMTKGMLSEYTVPELKDFAKEESEKDADRAKALTGYQEMKKDELLDGLLSLEN